MLTPLLYLQGTWATQLKNVEKLIEAYNKTEHVIFFFSVNQSKAFQGYVCHLITHSPAIPN